MLVELVSLLVVVGGCHSDVPQLPLTESPPPRPYAFAYTAGRYPGHADRHHAEVSDGTGVVRGTFSYLDPRQKLHKVDYVADKEGFHPVLNDSPPDLPRDSAVVAHAKERHHQLYDAIAADHAANPHPLGAVSALPRQSAAVAAAAEKHASLFRVIAEQHARIAAERDQLQHDDQERAGHLQHDDQERAGQLQHDDQERAGQLQHDDQERAGQLQDLA